MNKILLQYKIVLKKLKIFQVKSLSIIWNKNLLLKVKNKNKKIMKIYKFSRDKLKFLLKVILINGFEVQSKVKVVFILNFIFLVL